MHISTCVRSGSIPGRNEKRLGKPVYAVSLIYKRKVNEWENVTSSIVERTCLFVYVPKNFVSCKDLAPSVYHLCAECFYPC